MEHSPHIAAPSDVTVEPLTDSALLSRLAFQRHILDWRDNAHVEMTQAMATLCRAFVDHVDSRLGEVKLIDSWFADPADEVLRYDFIPRIQQPMTTCLYRLEAALEALATQQEATPKTPISFDRTHLKAGRACLVGVKFKPSERDTMVDRLKQWMLGHHGLVVGLRDQATRMADQLMQERQTC